MTVFQTRFIHFAGSALAIEYSGSESAKVVDFLFRHAPAHGDTSPHLTYRLLPGDGDTTLTLYRGETLLYTGADEGVLAEQWLGDACYHLAEQSRGGLLLHAAALTWQNCGLLLPGTTGAGKSTLAAWLLTQGFDYLTDELVFVPDGSATLSILTRPLNLKTSARSVLQTLFNLEGQANHILTSPDSLLVPPTLLKPTNHLSEPPLSLIIFPRYQPNSQFAWRPLSKAQAGLALMEVLVNARNLPDHGFPEIARLCQQAPAFQMTYADFAQVAGQLEDIREALLANPA